MRKNKSKISFDISSAPKRIVSLVPSQTELLFDLGLDEEVVGITRFCVHPEAWFRKKQRVGGTKTVKTDVVKALQPDLIIANKEENVKEQIEELQQIAPVFVSDINTLNDALAMILLVGKLVQKEKRASQLASEIEEAFKQITPLNQETKVAYFIWKDPYMAAGGDTFINDMLMRCGFTNIFQRINRYPEVSIGKFSIIAPQPISHHTLSINNQLSSGSGHPSTTNHPSSVKRHLSTTDHLLTQNCQLLLLSSEPYPFKQKHVDELQALLPSARIMLVDGEAFSWYGSRLLYSAQYFKNLINQIQG